MFQLYNKKNISILWVNKKNKISVNFCNIDMKLKNCQFRLFYYYLNAKSKEINGKIKNVELQLVKENLKVKVSLNDFFYLLNGVEMVMKERFGYNHNKKD
jgi:hypothetical protein